MKILNQETISQDDLQSYSLEETKDIVLGKRGVLTREIYEAELKISITNISLRNVSSKNKGWNFEKL
jgi:hypothetical protein